MRRIWIVLTATALAALLTGCSPKIGDPCTSSIDCPELSQCDTTAVGGYCLIFDCEDRPCQGGSVCVPFDTFSACMLWCRNDSNCRTEDGQICRTDIEPYRFCYHEESVP